MSSTSSGVVPDGKIYCNCKPKEEAVKRKSGTSKHPDREFYCCKKSPGSKSRCRFLVWADTINPQQNIAMAHSHPIQGVQSPASVPRATNNLIETPQSRKRLQDIKTGLRQREQDLSPTRHLGTKESGSSKFLELGHEPIPQPPSPVPTEIVDEAEEQGPRKTYSFLGLTCTPETTTVALADAEQPSTSKKRRTSPTGDPVTQPSNNAPASGGKQLLTPPKTTYHKGKKGKEKEGMAKIHDQDGDAHYEVTCELGELDGSLPLFALPEDPFQTNPDPVTPSTADNVYEYTKGIKARVKVLMEYMDSFDITQATDLLRTVERQRMRQECRDGSQKMRMEELVAEVADLREALRRCEDDNRTKEAEIVALRSRLWGA